MDREELIKIREHTSDLEGHPTPRLPFVDAASFASHYKLNNMIAFVDVNRLGQGTETQLKVIFNRKL